MAGTHREAVLNELSKLELVQLLLNIEANMGTHLVQLTTDINKINNHLKKLKAYVAAAKNVNSGLFD